MIDRFMPVYSLRQVDRVAVAADPDDAYAAVRSVDLYRIAFARFLFALRTLPDRLAARLRGRLLPARRHSGIEDITHPGSGFLLLDEVPGQEVVVGSIGKFWLPAIQYAPVSPSSFAAFHEAGFGKLAWCLRVDRREGGGSWIGVDLRVGATDPTSLARFKRYWWIIGPFSHAIRKSLLRAYVRELGGGTEDGLRPLPGDGLLATGRYQRTHAITIEAPRERVWPWLVQMGGQRAGWYSIDSLDNGGVRSAERIRPDLQHLSVGDIVPARPKGTEGFAVLLVEPERALVLGSPSLLPDRGTIQKSPPPWRSTWAFVLESVGDGASRLVVRVRADHDPSLHLAISRAVLATAHEVMERAQLHNLKLRAERREEVAA